MENLKIRVANSSESKEVQELFFELGYSWNGNKKIQELSYPVNSSYWLCTKTGMGLFNCIKWGTGHDSGKLITLPELRDLVVLKRNDVGDANYKANYGTQCYITGEDVYVFRDNRWFLSAMQHKDILDMIKPIEKKEMKEYLHKNSNNTYSYIGTVRPEHVSDFMIEIPDGTDFVTEHTTGTIRFWRKGSYKTNGNNHDWIDMTCHNEKYDAAYWCEISPSNIIWQRHTHPEALPFIDDDPSLNDQYAEIEKVRQSAWQKQEGGSHYKNLKIQPMQYALENKLDYAQANVVKYVTRHKEKNGKEDLLKAIHNLELMIEFYYGGEE